MVRRHSHSGIPSEQPETDWWDESLTPYYLKQSFKRKPDPLPSVEEIDGSDDEPEKVVTYAIHMSMLDHYIRETEGS